MPLVNALEIWKKLSESDGCREAMRYYDRKYWNISPDLDRNQEILDQGAADFDEKYCANDAHEKEHYRTDYYVGKNGPDVWNQGLMNMHLK